MYEPNEAFEAPKDGHTRIWRYLDFTKFVSLIDQQALFFCRSDKLGDPFEGSYTKQDIADRSALWAGLPPPARQTIEQQVPEVLARFRSYVLINAWHMNDIESEAMWRRYLKTDEGLAIVSTFDMLKSSFCLATDHKVYIGQVKYIDYDRGSTADAGALRALNALTPFMYKRRSFEHERELRAVTLPISFKETAVLGPPPDVGAYVPVDLTQLIDHVYVAPTAKPWFHELVKSVVDRYGLAKPVSLSRLLEPPAF